MKSSILLVLVGLIVSFQAQAQIATGIQKAQETPLPFYQIPDYPEDYSCGNIVGRLIDGLGYRYYWATEGLLEADLAYKPSDDSRTVQETLDHLLGLSSTIANAIKKEPNIRPANRPKLSFEEQRKLTLENIKIASDLLKAGQEGDLEEFKIVFQRGERKSEFPFWNLLNGPIADALYHVGQVVAYRRASGNPMNPNVNVFMGKTRE